MQNPPPVQTTKSSTGLDENIAALLAIIFGWLGGLIFFLIEKESRFVRFYAMQSILLNVLVLVVFIVLWIATVVLVIIGAALGDAVGTLVGILSTLLWLALGVGVLIAVVMCLIKAYQKQYFKLPIIGNMAEKFSAK
ncbi:MAG TPA: DUF4870 domain-containing protein [Pyrinomonadaceae bacterium]|nr:DUF4870 domain-containing protein [Pyrinomonadaceae bacterium]